MSDGAQDADEIIARLRAKRKEPVTRRFEFVTRHVEFDNVGLESAAASVEQCIAKVQSSLEAVNAPMRVLDVIITPLNASLHHYGEDPMGKYDSVEIQRGLVITFKLG